RPGDGHAVDDDLLRIRQYEPEALEVVDREGLVDTLRAHVGAWTSIERASLNTFEFLLEPNRDRAFAKVHFELGGPNPGGGLSVADRRQLPSQFLFVDLDGDGLEELVSNRVSYLGNRAWMGIYTRRGGKWVFLPHALEFENPPGLIRSDAQSMTAGDVNG